MQFLRDQWRWVTVEHTWKGKIPAAQFFAGVPFGLTAKEMNAWLHRGG